MRSGGLQLACVQPPTSIHIRPLGLSSREFGEIFGNYIPLERNTTDRIEGTDETDGTPGTDGTDKTAIQT